MSSEPFRLLFVCLGNICRSPLAEGICRHLAVERGLEKQLEIDSCGTGSWHIGEKPHVETIRVADRHKVKLDGIRARQIIRGDLEEFDLVVAMDRQNLSDIEDLNGGPGNHIVTMRDYDSNRDSIDVPDPYFGGRDGFQDVFDILFRSIEQLLDDIEEEFLN